MMNTLKQNIADTLQTFADAPLRDAATRVLNTLGYHSERTGYPALDVEILNRFRAAGSGITRNVVLDNVNEG